MCDTSSDDESIHENHEISSDASGALSNGANYSLSKKSKSVYNKTYDDFMKWKTSKNWNSFKEKVLVAYFQEISDKFKPSSLNTIYSILKSMLMIHHEVDISKYSTLLSLLKSKASGSTVKKAKTFTADEINRFLKEAHDYDHLLTKVAVIFGVLGACRGRELYNIKFNDVEDYPSKILVKIYNMDRATSMVSSYRIFTVTGNYYEVCKKYISLRPPACEISNFFLQYKSGKIRLQPLGINQLVMLSKSVARFLDLPDPDLYTGHSFRKTSANVKVNFDENIFTSRRDNISGLRLKEPELRDHNTMNSTSNNKTASENRNDTNRTKPEDHSNCDKDNFRVSNQFPNTFENQDFESVNINIANSTTLEDSSDSMDSKSHVWNQIQNAIINTPKFKVPDPIPNSLENKNKVLNLNMTDVAAGSDLQESLNALVHFNNCKIHNLNVNYSK